ncbi:MAG: tetratricopeptide repeat protein [Alphaproteobacteria bacterium]|nr:tetratricopeptide repeat protein [Alphaproteobacteria bacterium]
MLLASCTSSGPNAASEMALNSTGNPEVDRQAQAFRSVQLWSAAYEANSNDVINIIGYAKALSGIGSETRAIKVLDDGAVKYPKDPSILRSHAKILSKQGLVGPALRKMQAALKYAPNEWRLYNDIGELHSKMGEQSLAIDSFKRALKLNPNNPNIHTNMGVTYMFNKQLILAEKHLGIAIKHPNATAKMRQNYAFTLGLQGKYKAARKMFLQDLTLEQVNANIVQLKTINGDS